MPRTDAIHLHHGVWLSNGAAGQGGGNSLFGGALYPFMAAGEEKTKYILPPGYGYPIGAHDAWVLNYMIHDLTPEPAKVFITYNIDFVPMTTPLAQTLTPVHPIWMDVEDHNIYPVFDVIKGSGRHGKFTFPDMAKNPYGSGAALNEFPVDHPGTLVVTAGHLHPGGLYDELDLVRTGARPRHGAIPGPVPHSVRLFRSYAHYFGHRPPISWDMAMQGTNRKDWRVQIKAGDVLRISATYDTTRASWYESMGIMVVWEAWDVNRGVDPFDHKLDQRGYITHGHLPENDHYGGAFSLGVNLKSLHSCRRRQVTIKNFFYRPGDFALAPQTCIPTVTKGSSLAFENLDASPGGTFSIPANPLYAQSIFHSVTSCQNPCGLDTGISYPLANGAVTFDSGQLGAGLPAIGRLNWSSPTNLPPGTYTFYCRIHPFMRGVFRVVG